MAPWEWIGRALRARPREAATNDAPTNEAIGPLAAAHIAARLRRLGEPVSAAAGDAAVEDRILSALLSKRFRKFAVSSRQRAGIEEAVRRNVRAGAPIRLWFPMGGYKLWRFDEAPEPDWAELFALIHCADWLKPVAALYPPGVVLEFASDAIIVERLNNLLPAETGAYARGFTALLEFVSRALPANLVFAEVPIGSLYTPAEFEAEFARHLAAVRAKNGGKPPALWPKVGASIELNVRPRPRQTRDRLWREKVFELLLAYNAMERREQRISAPDRIVAWTNRLEHRNCIPIGSTKASVAKFWAGVGAIAPTDAGFIEAVLSPAQARGAPFAWAPVAITGLGGRNFRRVRVLHDRLG